MGTQKVISLIRNFFWHLKYIDKSWFQAKSVRILRDKCVRIFFYDSFQPSVCATKGREKWVTILGAQREINSFVVA